jgi:hypothetical protein
LRDHVELSSTYLGGNIGPDEETEITSGGPGIDGNCCGITVGVKNGTGDFYIATEDWREILIFECSWIGNTSGT